MQIRSRLPYTDCTAPHTHTNSLYNITQLHSQHKSNLITVNTNTNNTTTATIEHRNIERHCDTATHAPTLPHMSAHSPSSFNVRTNTRHTTTITPLTATHAVTLTMPHTGANSPSPTPPSLNAAHTTNTSMHHHTRSTNDTHPLKHDTHLHHNAHRRPHSHRDRHDDDGDAINILSYADVASNEISALEENEYSLMCERHAVTHDARDTRATSPSSRAHTRHQSPLLMQHLAPSRAVSSP